MNIKIISGSPRPESATFSVALFLKSQLNKNKHINADIIDVRDWQMPLLQKVYAKKEDVPEQFLALYDQLYEAEAFIFLSPEYNGSYSPALKNLIDHFAKGPFSRKAVGIATASPGAMGGMRAAQQMLLMVPALFAVASPHLLIVPKLDEKFDDNGQLLEAAFQKSTDRFIEEFLWLAKAVRSA